MIRFAKAQSDKFEECIAGKAGYNLPREFYDIRRETTVKVRVFDEESAKWFLIKKFGSFNWRLDSAISDGERAACVA